MTVVATAEASPYLAPAFGLAGVVVGGVIAGAVALFLDARRRKDEREARREQREHDNALRHAERLSDTYTDMFKVFDDIAKLTSMIRLAYTLPNAMRDGYAPHKASALKAIADIRTALGDLAPLINPHAPEASRAAYAALLDAATSTAAKAALALDTARLMPEVELPEERLDVDLDELEAAVTNMGRSARRDLGHHDPSGDDYRSA